MPKVVFGSTLAAVLVLGLFAFYGQQNTPSGLSYSAPVSPVQQSNFGQDTKTVKAFSQARATFLDEEIITPATPRVETAIQRETRRPQPRVERASYVPTQENDFVAVTYVGDGAESTRGGRVIRVDVPRSTLFAMGFPVSLENDSPTVKADLLIGPDGATRAVRLVE